MAVPPSGGSLEIGNLSGNDILDLLCPGSPFGGIPRNWKQENAVNVLTGGVVPPSGGSLEIGNRSRHSESGKGFSSVFPSGGS